MLVIVSRRVLPLTTDSSTTPSCRLRHTRLLYTLIRSLILSRLDYCNSLFVCFSQMTLLCGVSPRTHAPPLLKRLHCLPVSSRVQFKLLLQISFARMCTSMCLRELDIPVSCAKNGWTDGNALCESKERIRSPLRQMTRRRYAAFCQVTLYTC